MIGQLAGKRILIVEDEYFIAADLQRALQAEGAEIVGPVGDVGRALALAAEKALDAAILDVNLEGSMSFPIAERLAADQVPFLFLTGYDDWSLPSGYDAAPRVAKPFSTPRVVDAVSALCGGE